MNNLMVIDGIEVRRDAYGRYSLTICTGLPVLWISISLHSGSAMSKLNV